MADSQLGFAIEFAVPLLIGLSQNWLPGLPIADGEAVTPAPVRFSFTQTQGPKI